MIPQNLDPDLLSREPRGVTEVYPPRGAPAGDSAGEEKNRVRKLREDLLLSRAELAKKAGLSPVTVNRVERGMNCRMSTKRKILIALGLKIEDKDKIFPSSRGKGGG